MKTFKEYLPESFLTELGAGPNDSISPVSGAESSGYPDPAESKFGNRELNVGDPVIITGNVEFSGKTGDVAAFGRDNHFVIVNLYNHGKHSFHASNVAYNDYADEEHEGDDDADEDDRALYDLRKLSGY
jgi:hypothetical protein